MALTLDMIRWVFIAIIAVAIAGVLFHRFFFLRKPKRIVPKGNVVVSPGSGKIVRILEIGGQGKTPAGRLKVNKGLMGKVNLIVKDTIKSGYVIVIMMTPLDVHYQRAPVEGTVERVVYRKGTFRNAVKDASSMQALENEKSETIIMNPKIGRVKVVQVAGFLARRIRCFVRPKQKIHKGEEIGVIRLGSQVILVIPRLKLVVKEGQRVVDGETIIARF